MKRERKKKEPIPQEPTQEEKEQIEQVEKLNEEIAIIEEPKEEIEEQPQLSKPKRKYNNTNRTKKPTTQQTTPEDLVERLPLIEKYDKYFQTFILKREKRDTSKLSNDQLKYEIEQIITELESNGSLSSAKTALLMGMTAVEYTTTNIFNPLGLDLTGLSSVMATNINNQHIENTLKELLLKYDLMMRSPPEMRLGMAILNVIISVDATNKKNKPKPSEKVETEITEKYKDI